MNDKYLGINAWLIYAALWVIVSIAQSVFLVYSEGFSWFVSIADSAIFCIIYGIIGLGIYFMVRYSGNQGHGFVEQLMFYFTGAVLSVGLWLGLSYTLITSVNLEGFDNYHSFLLHSLFLRALIGILVYTLMFVLFKYLRQAKELVEMNEHEASLTGMLRDAELNMLRSQIRPHFLFNSLNSVSALTLSNPDKAQEMVVKLAEFMRYSLGLSGNAFNSVKNEVHQAGLYLDIERVRFSDRMTVEINLDEKCSEIQIPALLTQPLLENSIKHGINTLIETSLIKVDIFCAENLLHFIISNQFDPDAAPRPGTGTGLANVKKRLAALYGRYDLLTYNIANNVFTIELKIPYDKNLIQ
jgi:two-component system, LytTR family, sensor kinase